MIDGWGIFCILALGWSSSNLTNDKSTSAQVMAWCHQVTSHCLNQCWPSSISPYGITRPQCVNQHIPQHHIPQHQCELKLNKVVAKITIASKVTPFNGSLYGLTSIINFVVYIVCLFGCKELYSHLYALSFQLRYVPLFGHHKSFCSKFVLISNNYIFFQNHFILYSSFVSKLMNGILKGCVFVALSLWCLIMVWAL